jgi:hypothetical protein
MLSGDLPFATASLYQPGWRPRPDQVSEGFAGLRYFAADFDLRAPPPSAADHLLDRKAEIAGDLFHRLARFLALALLEGGDSLFDVRDSFFRSSSDMFSRSSHNFRIRKISTVHTCAENWAESIRSGIWLFRMNRAIPPEGIIARKSIG